MEANWSAIVFLLLVTGVAVCVSKAWTKRWFNPLSLYSFVWGVCLTLYELRLIQYYDVSRTAWTFVILAWASLYLGALLVKFLVPPQRQTISAPTDLKRRLNSYD